MKIIFCIEHPGNHFRQEKDNKAAEEENGQGTPMMDKLTGHKVFSGRLFAVSQVI
ncbi:MAG TPA: hypothetical protein VLJ10_04330 [Candidatus Bathyarchaeia archaeon]|nr:hypothetical protein [Candidatus Bathyarchaeia archaeon]